MAAATILTAADHVRGLHDALYRSPMLKNVRRSISDVNHLVAELLQSEERLLRTPTSGTPFAFPVRLRLEKTRQRSD